MKNNGSAHLKHIETSSSGEETVGHSDFLLRMVDITEDGQPLASNAALTWLVSRVFPSRLLGRLDARNKRA